MEKIKRDGVDKANAEAAAIVNKAKAEAATIVKDAETQAEAAKAAAKTQAEQDAERAAETIRQAARDTVLKVESAVTSLLSALLAKSVDAALADPAVAAPLAAEAVKALVKGDAAAEVAANGKLVEALRAQLAAQANIKVVLDEATQAGFTVKLDGGRVEHDFTGAVVTDALASRLRPDLAKLLK
ncbi:MAG: hypothetical protein MJ240_12405 [Kiritimatiellae bacterium]|nr:hypothetical protein [Kiritimatiellia bacterium]